MNLAGCLSTKQRGAMYEADMSDQSELRKWAAEAAQRARTEKDANEARRLQSFAQYWTRLADTEEWQRDHEVA
jgi:hypothetical protein